MSALSFYCAVNPKGPYENKALRLVVDDAVFVERLRVGLGQQRLGGRPAGLLLDRLRVAGPEVDRKLQLLPHLCPHGLVFIDR